MKPSDSIWWFTLGVDWSTGNVINGKKFYATADNGCLIIHPCGAIQFIGKNWY